MRTAYDRRPEDEEELEGESAVALHPEEARALQRVAYVVAWGSVALGLILPWTIAALRLGFGAFWEALLGPEHDMRLAGVYNGVPFIAYGVFALIYLNQAVSQGRLVVKERRLGVSFAGALMVAVSATVVWFAPPGNVLLPLFLLVAFIAGFSLGRFLQDSDAEPG